MWPGLVWGFMKYFSLLRDREEGMGKWEKWSAADG